MVDHPDEFGPDAPQPFPPEGDSDADFFHELTDADSEPEAIAAHPVPEVHPTPAATGPGATPTPPPPPPPPKPVPPPPPPRRPAEAEPRRPIFPVIVGILFIGALVGAVIYGRKLPQEVATTTSVSAATAPASTSPDDALTDEVKSLQGKIDSLTAQTKDLQDRFEKRPQSDPASDLKPLRDRIDALAKTTESVAPLPERIDDLEGRVAAMDKSLTSLRNDIAALHGDLKKTVAGRPEATRDETAKADAATPRPEDVNVAGEGMEQGVELYKQRKFKEANDLFRKLTDEFPRDPRVWYYAALANGQATGQWRGETERLVNQGIDREKSGVLDKPQIDAVFTDLDPGTKKWLDYYRQRAR